jgi:hypothetical protein
MFSHVLSLLNYTKMCAGRVKIFIIYFIALLQVLHSELIGWLIHISSDVPSITLWIHIGRKQKNTLLPLVNDMIYFNKLARV